MMITRPRDAARGVYNGIARPAGEATIRERIAMAAGWPVADVLPDRLYSLMGRWLALYWEEIVLGPQRFTALEWLFHDLGALTQARAITEDAGQAILRQFHETLVERGYTLPERAAEIMAAWFEIGRSTDARTVVQALEGLGDPHHRPTRYPTAGQGAAR